MCFASRLWAGAVISFSMAAFAGSPATNRSMNNVKSAIGSVQLMPSC